MTDVFVVDESAVELADALNAHAKRDSQQTEYSPFTSLELFFTQLADNAPALILLHHHWHGLNVTDLLGRIAGITKNVRVIVFTGQELDIDELLECVRGGACDYWPKRGSLDLLKASRQISMYCSSGVHMLETLSRPSASVVGLLKQTESAQRRVVSLESQLAAAKSQLANATGEENKEFRRRAVAAVEYILCTAALGSVYVMVIHYSGHPGWALGLVAICSLFFLFLHGRIGAALFRWGSKSAEITR